MSRDPIFTAITVLIGRVAMFVLLSVAGWLLLWLLVLSESYGVAWRQWLPVTREAWPPAHDTTLALLWTGCGLIGVLTTLVVFLTVALWWRRSGDVHRRGTRFIDRREDN
jgi:hypothetical protein